MLCRPLIKLRLRARSNYGFFKHLSTFRANNYIGYGLLYVSTDVLAECYLICADNSGIYISYYKWPDLEQPRRAVVIHIPEAQWHAPEAQWFVKGAQWCVRRSE